MAQLVGTRLMKDASLKAYYMAEDANDSSGNALTLTNNGTTPFNPAYYANGFDLGSSNSTKYMSRADGLSVSLSSDFSFALWLKLYANPPTSGDSVFTFIDWASTTATARRVILYYDNTSGATTIGVNPRGGPDTTYVSDLNNGKYNQITVTCSGTSVTLYLNGYSVATGTAHTAANASNYLHIGHDGGGGGHFTSGIFDDVAFFTRALTDAEVRLLALPNSKLTNSGLRPAIFKPGIAR